MLYNSYSFCINNKKPTLTRKDGTTWGYNWYLSTLDKEKIKEIYN